MTTLFSQYNTFVDGVTSLPSKNNWAFSNRINELNMEGFDFSRFLTGAIGMIAEVTEFVEEYENDSDNATKLEGEIGDLFWYISNAANSLGGDIGTFKFNVECEVEDVDKIITGLIIHTGRFLDEAKKVAFHGKPLTDEKKQYFQEKLGLIIGYAFNLANNFSGVETIVLNNIKKLEARYPGGTFSIQASEVRNNELV